MTGLRQLVVADCLVSASPPARIYACVADDLAALERECLSGGLGCTGAVTPCPQCGFNLCAGHRKAHAKTVAWPSYAWKTTASRLRKRLRQADPTATAWMPRRLGLRQGGRLHAKPPAVVRYCRQPTIHLLDGSCAYGPHTCQGESSPCPWCEFPVCQRHQGNHRASLALPVPVWRGVVESYNRFLQGKLRYGPYFGRIPDADWEAR